MNILAFVITNNSMFYNCVFSLVWTFTTLRYNHMEII
nr:MAG TPA: hypothetical protein [Caudoviricetes sp.]